MSQREQETPERKVMSYELLVLQSDTGLYIRCKAMTYIELPDKAQEQIPEEFDRIRIENYINGAKDFDSPQQLRRHDGMIRMIVLNYVAYPSCEVLLSYIQEAYLNYEQTFNGES